MWGGLGQALLLRMTRERRGSEMLWVSGGSLGGVLPRAPGFLDNY